MYGDSLWVSLTAELLVKACTIRGMIEPYHVAQTWAVEHIA